MLFIAIIFTLSACLIALFVLYANGMRSSPGPFEGLSIIIAAFAFALVFWIGWALS